MDFEWTEHHTVAEACKRVPRGTACLLSALNFHDMGTQNAPSVFLALDPKITKPLVERPRLGIVRFSGVALTTGVEKHLIEGVSIRAYSVAKTVADCFKYRYKIGLNVALEAPQVVLKGFKGTIDEFMRCAKACRVQNVMLPYVQAMTV
ncbi:MAG: hypothetical protein H7338_10310 [Candidatus Sericytochromatia bacterium]|nr:hypothetical protein [Candidatus Sericytochromatia bacterium]